MRKLGSKYPFVRQLERMDCGPACLAMVAAFYGVHYTLQYLREACCIGMAGTSMEGLAKGAQAIGFRALAVKVPFAAQKGNDMQHVPLPAIAFWGQNHFVVVYKITSGYVLVADPAQGMFRVSVSAFKKNWVTDGGDEGILLLLQPTDQLYVAKKMPEAERNGSLRFLGSYLKAYRKFILFVLITILMISGIQYLYPMLTRGVIDTGIEKKQVHFIYLVLIFQLILFFCQTGLSFLQSWIILHLSSRINILLSSDFLYKLTRLPISFYDNKYYGEIIQRITDHRKVESFLSSSSIGTVLSFISLLVFGAVLFHYNPGIFLIFLSGTGLYIGWVFIFLKRRKMIDYELFHQSAGQSELMYEFIYGMHEIKLQNSERKRSLQWSRHQAGLLAINLKAARLNQIQDGGAMFINQLKDILITMTAAMLVIDNKITLGSLLAIQLIVGLMNGPVQQLVTLFRTGYETRLALDRIVEIHKKPEENYSAENSRYSLKPGSEDIVFDNVSFSYNPLSKKVLKNINLTIPKGRVTAIVGASGSGKTTLLKLLLGFYAPTEGILSVGSTNLRDIPAEIWRRRCGAVLQDGYIFSDSIAHNICESDDKVNEEKLQHAIHVANIEGFIDSLALKGDTIIGSKGNGLSQGQKQRILIARAVYKDSQYLFFDEATNALDTRNEKVIMENLDQYYAGRTVVIVAHRLSTVRNADQIIVLDDGMIVEQGMHSELVDQRNIYFTLIKNQLELGA
jgi:ATP-binding cassette subfamily B protein